MDFENTNFSKKQKNSYDVLRCLSKAKNPLTIPTISKSINISIPNATDIIKPLFTLALLTMKGNKSPKMIDVLMFIV